LTDSRQQQLNIDQKQFFQATEILYSAAYSANADVRSRTLTQVSNILYTNAQDSYHERRSLELQLVATCESTLTSGRTAESGSPDVDSPSGWLAGGEQ